MRKTLLGVVALCGFLGIGLAGMAMANSAVGGDVPAIMVSPSTIVLAKVNTISVHTNIPAGSVVAGSLDLNGAAPTDVYVDNLGHIAAKFAVADLDLEPGQATLTLSGDLEEDGSFSASDVVTVK
ncbi:MAG TPA: hypothetical protein PLU87_19195 [Sedimentisphaerales bacterium]|nr:hypothetical protein [Sedimentisphaerales bacterium]HRV49832.1 hypothetical protein [Sedimentisphaerales bacterium]